MRAIDFKSCIMINRARQEIVDIVIRDTELAQDDFPLLEIDVMYDLIMRIAMRSVAPNHQVFRMFAVLTQGKIVGGDTAKSVQDWLMTLTQDYTH